MSLKKTFALMLGLGMAGIAACGTGGTSANPTQDPAAPSKIFLIKLANSQGSPTYLFPKSAENLGVTGEEGGTAASKQTLITGTFEAEAYTGGALQIQAKKAEACGEGYCVVPGKAPLASIALSKPGYFSMVVPSLEGQHVTLVGLHGNAETQLYLGVLNQRLDGILLKI